MGYARFIHRLRWWIITGWVVLAFSAVLLLPSLSAVVAHKSATFLPSYAGSMVASRLANEVRTAHPYRSSAIVAIVDSRGLNEADKAYFKLELAAVDAGRAAYPISYLQDSFNSAAQLKSAFVSRNGTTEIALVGFPANGSADSTAAAYGRLRQTFSHPPSGAHVYLTGDAPISIDNVNISKNGVNKTVGVTVALVLLILLLVFRSLVAPFVTLATIGLSFLMTSGVVAWLAQRGFPVSTFTQTFLIAVIFGAGTDYSIVMLGRFREELTREHGDTITAVAASLRSVGKTVVYSALTVFVSFAVLYLARFGLYRSAVGVAVGVLITLGACLTLIPALMAVFGRALFWPRRPQVGAGHKPSRFWGFTGGLATRHPWWTLLAALIVLAPVAMLYTDQRSFNTLAETPQAPSVKGFYKVAEAFGIGHVLPLDIVLRTGADLRMARGLATIDHISQALAHAPGVASVDSATWPQGSAIAQFEIANQNGQAAAGLQKVQKGLILLQSGLTHTAGQVSAGANGQGKLGQGARSVAFGANRLAAGLKAADGQVAKLTGGAAQIGQGAGQLQDGLGKMRTGAGQLVSASAKLSSGAGELQSGAASVSGGAAKLYAGDRQLYGVAATLSNALSTWAKDHPHAAYDPTLQQILAMAAGLRRGEGQAQAAAGRLAAGASQLEAGASGLARNTGRFEQGLQLLQTDTVQLAQGAGGLAGGAGSLARGAQKFGSAMGQLSSGASSVAHGSGQVSAGIAQASGGDSRLATGLQSAASAAGQLQSGVQQVRQALVRSGQSATTGDPGFYVPESTVKSNAPLQQVMNAYISPDGHVTQFTVALNVNPYSGQAIADVSGIRQAAVIALSTGPIHTGKVYAGGTSASESDLNQISNTDFIRTVSLILIAIYILLVLMLRSVLTPLYILASLIGSYLVTMGVVQTIFVRVLGYSGIDWTTPFFALLLLVALGVDYSIFLMSRFDELLAEGIAPKDAILRAMKLMGGVVFSAAFIMGGTFGSMTVSGVTGLMEIGVSIVLGLFIYTGLLMGFFIPAAVTVVERAHHWPFRVRRAQTAGNVEAEPAVLNG